MATQYPTSLKKMIDGDIDFLADTIKVALLQSSYTYSAAHEFADDLTNEVSGGSYARQTLAGKASALDGTEAVFTADASVWEAVTLTARFAVIYKDTGDDATSPLIALIDFGGNQSVSAQDFTLKWDGEDEDGEIFRMAQAA